jgi:hypothetical protein
MYLYLHIRSLLLIRSPQDLEDEIDDLLADLKVQMEQACQADNQAREAGQPALHKLKLLPEVTAILNRNNVQHAVLDPDTNFLQHVKFFLEPLNDGSLPAYNIQRDIFNALAKMNIEKESLLSSGIGRVVIFYTQSKRPEPSIKRVAHRLLRDWSRPILNRTDDYKKRQIETSDYDYEYVPYYIYHTCILTVVQRCQDGTTPKGKLAIHSFPASCGQCQGCRTRASPCSLARQQLGTYGQLAFELHCCSPEHLHGNLKLQPSPPWCWWYGGIPQDDSEEQEASYLRPLTKTCHLDLISGTYPISAAYRL